MKLEEIREAYKGKWVLIEYRELDRNLEVVEGDVIAEAATKEEIYKIQMNIPGKNLAIRYCGEWPTDVAVMFCLRASGILMAPRSACKQSPYSTSASTAST